MTKAQRPQGMLFAQFMRTGTPFGGAQAGLDVLERHQVIMTGLAKKYGGVLVVSAANSFQIIFAGSEPAIGCALAARERFAHYNRDCDDPSHKVSLRQGVHAGAFDLRDGGVSGAGAEVLARLLAVTPGGRIFSTRQVYEEVRGLGRCAAILLGPEYFPGLPEPVEVFEIVPVPMATAAKEPGTPA